MKLEYICNDCGREISWSEYQNQSDIFCSECGGRIEEVDNDLASQPLNQSTKKQPSSVTKNSYLISCNSCSHQFSNRAKECPKCGWKTQVLCQVCQQKIPYNSTSCPECGDPEPLSSEEQKLVTGKEIVTKNGYAGFWFRAIAIIVDSIIAQLVSIITVIPLAFALGASMAGTSTASEIESTGYVLGCVMGILIQWLYFTISESSIWQATLGKKMFGIFVTDMDGNKIGFGKANARYWSKIISALILFIGFIMVAFTQNKQGLHDIIAGTLVMKKKV